MMQEPLLTLIRFDLILESISGVIALMISHQANTAYRLTEQKRLSDLSTGFLVLSASMFGRVIGSLYFFVIAAGGSIPDADMMQNVVSMAYGFLKIMAFVLFAVSTRRGGGGQMPSEAAFMALPFLIDPNLELIAILVLLIVVMQALMNYAAIRTRFALYVLAGFLFLLLSLIFGIFATMNISAYGVSQAFQFLGLMSFLVMLLKSGREQ
ncbi:MAG: hypothetical protein JSW61_09270 [Candidatus Thorarchaeota archaeon]|nr:MAG: hypothetical protein JSW61_09270 [Candidatus Thorarchaeota archaeon]